MSNLSLNLGECFVVVFHSFCIDCNELDYHFFVDCSSKHLHNCTVKARIKDELTEIRDKYGYVLIESKLYIISYYTHIQAKRNAQQV